MRIFTYLLSSLLGLAMICLPLVGQAQCGVGETQYTFCHNANAGSPTIAFEICPSAGEIATADITQGGFVFPGNTLTIYEGASGSGASGTPVLGPTTSGNFAGTMVSSTVPDLCLIFVFNFIPGTPDCATSGFDPQFEVCGGSEAPPSTATLTLTADEFCSNAGSQTLGGGLPIGGAYSGMGVTDDNNGTTFTFDPSGLSGTITITYTESGSMATDDIMVTAAGATTFDASLTTRCIDEGSLVLAGNVSPVGGTFSGPGVTDNNDGINFTFDPALAGIGMHTITYTGPAPCNDVVTDMIEVTAACTCPGGEVSYFHCQGNSESNLVAFEVCPSAAGMAVQATINSGTYNVFFADGDQLDVYSGASGSGTTGTLVSGALTGDLFGTVIMGSIADDCLIFVSNTGPTGSCQDGLETALSVCGIDIAPSVSFLDPGDFCETDLPQSGLTGGLPTGGIYSSSTPGAVTDAGDGENFTFTAVNGAGTYELIYTFGGGSDNVFVEVFASGAVSFTAPADLCIDAGIQSGLSGGSPAGGTYSGPGVTDNGNGTFDFNPAVAGLGVKTIMYTEPVGCMETAMDDVEVLAACGCPSGEQTFFHCTGNNENDLIIFELCPTDPNMAIEATIDQGWYSVTVPDGDELTIYAGAQGSGTGGTIVFGPQGGDLAATVVRSSCAGECLTFVSNTGPVNSCQDGFELALQGCAIDILPNTKFTPPADLCTNAGIQAGLSGGTPSGGTYSGDIPGAVMDNGDGTYDLDPSVGPGTLTITYTANGEAASGTVELQADAGPPSIVGTLNPENIEGCTLADAPVAATTVAELEAMGLTISDDCSDNMNLMVSSSDVVSGTCPIVITRTYTITDEGGQSSMIAQTINIDDDTDPNAVCQNFTLVLDGNGVGTLQTGDIDGGSTDNCGNVSLSIDLENFDCDDLGDHTVTLTATDDCDNTNDCTATVTVTVDGTLPGGWTGTDVGQTTIGNDYFFNPCTATNPADGEWTVTGSGNNAVSTTTDNVAFAHTQICGDGAITAKIESVSPNGYGGLMIRESTDADGKQIAVFSNMSSILRHETRYSTGANKVVQAFFRPNPFWLKLERQGDWFFAYYSTTGIVFQYVHAVYVPTMPDCLEFGLASFTYQVNQQTAAVFSNVDVTGSSMIITPPIFVEDVEEVQDKIGVNLYPNPAKDQFTVKMSQPALVPVRLSLYNHMGQLIEEQVLQAGAIQLDWDAANLPAGNYFLKGESNQQYIEARPITIMK